ncbi:MAG: NCS2 family permease [Clostridia bacterium]|nr:NCS2 family permease [Clostridia bacterium]
MDKFFKISERKSTVRTEIVAGLTTFFAMAYIVVTNPNQIVSFDRSGDLGRIWNAVYVASILSAFLGTILMALYAKLPFAQACGMGLNSFFFVSFILPELLAGENGNVIDGYQAGLIIILLEGLIFLVLSLTGVRSYIAKSLPDCLKKAIPAGIGLFIAFIGFQNVHLIETNQYTLVQFFDFHGALSGEGTAFEKWVNIAPVVLAIVGFIVIASLVKRNVKGAVLIGILVTSVLYYLSTWQLPTFDFGQIGESFKDFGALGLGAVFKGSAWAKAFNGGTIGAIFSALMLVVTFCLVDVFDTIGTLYGTASQADMLDDNGDPIDVDKAMACDSIATVGGAVFGTSTTTTFVESASGVAAGGRTGLTSLVTAICFLLCLVLSPIASIIPGCATAPALIFVGVLMLKGFAKVDMDDMRSAVPAFLALVMMPLTYSIANGIGIGAIAYTLMTIFAGKYSKKDIVVTIIGILFVLKFVLITM